MLVIGISNLEYALRSTTSLYHKWIRSLAQQRNAHKCSDRFHSVQFHLRKESEYHQYELQTLTFRNGDLDLACNTVLLAYHRDSWRLRSLWIYRCIHHSKIRTPFQSVCSCGQVLYLDHSPDLDKAPQMILWHHTYPVAFLIRISIVLQFSVVSTIVNFGIHALRSQLMEIVAMFYRFFLKVNQFSTHLFVILQLWYCVCMTEPWFFIIHRTTSPFFTQISNENMCSVQRGL